MKNVVKNSFYVTVWLIMIWLTNVNAAIAPWEVSNKGIVTEGDAATIIQQWLTNLLSFLYLLAVLLGIWGGFNILTAAWDEEKVKKGKTIIIQALIWVVVIFLAGSIVEWLLTLVIK